MDIIAIFAAIASSIGAILSWVAKIRWSTEFKEAKDEVIRAKQAQIEVLEREIKMYQDLDSAKIVERFVKIRSLLEDNINELEAERNSLAGQLTDKKQEYESEIRRLKAEIKTLENSLDIVERFKDRAW